MHIAAKKTGRPKKVSFESKTENLPPISREAMGDMVKALSPEGRKELQQEEADCREAEKMVAYSARREMTLLKAKADGNQAILRVIDESALHEEFYNALIRSWARRKKSNPDGWQEEIRGELVKISKEYGLNDEVKYERLAFYKTLAQYIKDRCKFTMEDDAIRKAIQREFELLR